MQIVGSKPGHTSCADVEVASISAADGSVTLGFACSHGTVLCVRMSDAEARELRERLAVLAGRSPG